MRSRFRKQQIWVKKDKKNKNEAILISNKISKILGEQGPEIYKIILSYITFEPIKRVELCINKNITNFVNDQPIYIDDIHMGKEISCRFGCGNKICIDANTIYSSYTVTNIKDKDMRDKYNPKYLLYSPKCAQCTGLYIRTQKEYCTYFSWNRCSRCKVLYIGDVGMGFSICDICLFAYYETKVTMKQHNFLYQRHEIK
jgi:hypothetical protein